MTKNIQKRPFYHKWWFYLLFIFSATILIFIYIISSTFFTLTDKDIVADENGSYRISGIKEPNVTVSLNGITVNLPVDDNNRYDVIVNQTEPKDEISHAQIIAVHNSRTISRDIRIDNRKYLEHQKKLADDKAQADAEANAMEKLNLVEGQPTRNNLAEAISAIDNLPHENAGLSERLKAAIDKVDEAEKLDKEEKEKYKQIENKISAAEANPSRKTIDEAERALENYSSPNKADLSSRLEKVKTKLEKSNKSNTSTTSSFEKSDNHQNNQSKKTVYIARKGDSKVYWYDKNKMPSSTNFDNVVSMTEDEALSIGKKHSPEE
ncbi:hypothetical protein BG261_00045 [Floricoccus tropicus]|uniref:Uncharacterized protein n=1 Tax=Floricoccus tropicus TaxID=1859473 RepID=A0A1E8GPZ7_9LACT|nr:hypothetical protein [Floricoccus tropicus]OFI50314.1 hypothetical protein BG261_00045 [Floricoccus tropicus]